MAQVPSPLLGQSTSKGIVTMVQPGPIRVALDAHVVGRRGTGNETYIVNLATALAARSDIVPLVYVDAGTPWPGETPAEVRRLRTRTPFLRIPLELPIRARRDRADVLHVQYVGPPIAGLPLVTTIHDVSFEDVAGLFSRRTELRLKLMVPRSARRSAAVVTISEHTRGRLIHHYDLDPDRVFVSRLGVAERWRPLADDERRSRLARLGLVEPFVLSVGNLHPRKNIPRLVRAVAAARRAGVGDLRLVIVGQRGWRASDVDAEVDAVGGEDWVRFLGFVDDDVLQALYGAAAVVAYPSLYEGFGLPVLEALACGAVVVASNATAIPEAAGDAAILVDPRSVQAIEQGLVQAITNQALRTRLTVAGPIHAAEFTWVRCAEGTAAAYRAALTT